jgi:GntR family transcriptional regulator/MocR family aminotransferase
MSWHSELAVALDPEAGHQPLFQQIANGVAGAIRSGRLGAGDRLPGSRTLAESLDVHRNTVIAAFEELRSQGWISGQHGRGTFVSAALPVMTPRRFAGERNAVPAKLGFSLAPHRPAPQPIVWPPPPGMLSMAAGVPDLRLAPATELARAYRRALQGASHAVLDYGDPAGHPRLREELAAMLNALRGLGARANDVFVSRGSQMGLYLVARSIMTPGAVVAVEALGYSPAWEAFRTAGARLVPIPVDRHGMQVDRLRALAEREPVRAVYLTPHHQYPTTAVLSADRRLSLLDLARRQRMAIVEDDYDNEVHYQGRPILPLASADDAGVVVYIGTLSKILAPGLRVGYVVAPRPILERMAGVRRAIDRQGDPAIERAVAELLEEGTVQRHARRMRRVYRTRRDALAASLRSRLAGAIDFDLPAGGMAIWVRVAGEIDIDAWAIRGREIGVDFHPARTFAFDGRSRPFARLGYAALNEEELDEAVTRMAASLDPPRSRAHP